MSAICSAISDRRETSAWMKTMAVITLCTLSRPLESLPRRAGVLERREVAGCAAERCVPGSADHPEPGGGEPSQQRLGLLGGRGGNGPEARLDRLRSRQERVDPADRVGAAGHDAGRSEPA